MDIQQVSLLVILAATVGMFLWGRWRHDMVAAGALLTCVLVGLIPSTDAFAGFGHPAVITVACVLVLSRSLQTSGAVDALTRLVLPSDAGPTLTVAALAGLGALLSAFMNNVGALALLMPVAIQMARRRDLPPGRLLMPLAFGSILGGMTTLIGTPPNLIVSGFRAEAVGDSFAMFDFTPVGVTVAIAGLLVIVLGGWRLVPLRSNAAAEGFDTGAYLTEARIREGSKAHGMALRDIEAVLEEHDAQVVGMVRNDLRAHAPNPGRMVREGDILVLEIEADALAGALSALELELEEGGEGEGKGQAEAGKGEEGGRGGNIVLQEIAVLPASTLTGSSASDLLLRTRYGINLLAISREGERSMKRLRSERLRAGDLLLMQGTTEAITEFASDFGCVPLAERELRIPDRRRAILATIIMAFAVGGAAFGLVPAAVSFAAGVLASMALRTLPLREVYRAIDWPVIVLLAALIPVAGAMEATGTADLIASFLIGSVAQGHAVVGLALVMVVTMTLSDLMNNAATAAVMCPIAIGTAAAVGASPDPFLMAVAVGASCAFLTPIGHQNNTLILGPGGFRFGDYWRLGLPVQLVVIGVSIPVLLVVWPL